MKFFIGCLIFLFVNITWFAVASYQDGETDSDTPSMFGTDLPGERNLEMEIMMGPGWECWNVYDPVFDGEGNHIGDDSYTMCGDIGIGILIIVAIVIAGISVDLTKREPKEKKQTCDDDELAEREEEKNNMCNQPSACTQNIIDCDEIKRRYFVHAECIRMRIDITRECWNNYMDSGHFKQIRDKRRAQFNCRKQWKRLKCEGNIITGPIGDLLP